MEQKKFALSGNSTHQGFVITGLVCTPYQKTGIPFINVSQSVIKVGKIEVTKHRKKKKRVFSSSINMRPTESKHATHFFMANVNVYIQCVLKCVCTFIIVDMGGNLLQFIHKNLNLSSMSRTFWHSSHFDIRQICHCKIY